MPGSLQFVLYQWFWAAANLLFPPVCAGCEVVGSAWCERCQRQVTRLTGTVCERCGRPLPLDAECPTCSRKLPAYDAARSFAVFDGAFREAIHQLKYNGNTGLGEALAFPALQTLEALHWPISLVVPVPLGRARQQARGYNQAALLSFPLAAFLGKPHRPHALRRVRETPSQVGLSFVDRQTNVAGAFYADRRMVAGQHVLLVDDVMTTGATLDAAAQALKQAQAAGVYTFTLARAVQTDGPHNPSHPYSLFQGGTSL